MPIKPKQTRGFSLVEVLIALVVIAIALLGLISAFTYGLRANESSEQRAVALNHARTLMGETRQRADSYGVIGGNSLEAGLADAADADRTALAATPYDTGQVPAGTTFERNIQITKPLGAGYRANISRITVRVYWKERGSEKHVEFTAYTPWKQDSGGGP